MNNIVETKQLTETTRLVARYSEGYSFSDIFGEGWVSIETIRCADRLTEYRSDLLDEVGTGNYELVLTNLGYSYKKLSLAGSAPSEWHEVLVWMDDKSEVSDFIVKTIHDWYRGEVYDIDYQVAKTFTADDGETIVRWDTESTTIENVGDVTEVLNYKWR